MTIKVDLNPETEARLAAEAHAQGLPVERVAERILNDALANRSFTRGAMNVEQFHEMLEAMAQGSDQLPGLPTSSFSRESFYEDRLNGGDAVSPR
jgi:hypothetical protein